MNNNGNTPTARRPTEAEEIYLLKHQLAAKDALLSQARDVLMKLDKGDDDRCFMNGEEIAIVGMAIEAIDKELRNGN